MLYSCAQQREAKAQTIRAHRATDAPARRLAAEYVNRKQTTRGIGTRDARAIGARALATLGRAPRV